MDLQRPKPEMSQLRIGFALLVLLFAAFSTAAEEVHPRLTCPEVCADSGDQPRPCGGDCGQCACCIVIHLVQPAAATTAVVFPPATSRPYFPEPSSLVSRAGTDVFHVPRSSLA